VTQSGRGPVVLVNSGAFVAQELVAEFGELPPAFLPIGLGRLYELQARMLAPLDGDLYLTVPESFELAEWDAQRLQGLGFTVIRTADALSLGAALLYTLGRLGFHDRPLRILHGDTLLNGIDLEANDIAAVAEGGDSYRWAHVTVGADRRVETVTPPAQPGIRPRGPRLCGYFAFESAMRFAEHLAICDGDFYGALNRQAAMTGLRAAAPERWFDFGHVQTFFSSRRIVTTERAFNSLQIGTMHVRKRSTSAVQKLRAEARWLREVPPSVAPFCARVLQEGNDEKGYFYDSEYEFMPTLAELYVFGRLGTAAWTRILGSCGDFVHASKEAGGNADVAGLLHRLVVDKTVARLDTLRQANNLDLDAPNTLNGRPAPSLRQCMDDIRAIMAGCDNAPSVMHGDFCFSNILYDFRTDRIRLIDPRGMTERGEFSLYGDLRYDLAKLMHSLCGRYDMIMVGQYTGGRTAPQTYHLSFPEEGWRLQMEELAKSISLGGVRLGSPVVWAAMISLFLSMPPLHADRPDRQDAFIANALRLHLEMENAA